MIRSIIQKLFFIKIQLNMNKQDKESMICIISKSSQNFSVNCIQNKENFLSEREYFKKTENGGLNKNRSEGFFNFSRHGDLEGPNRIIRKYANELEVNEKSVKTAIKQDLNPDVNLLNTLYEVF